LKNSHKSNRASADGAGQKRSIRHYRGWRFIPLVLFVLVLSETVLVLEEKYWDFVNKRAKYWGYSFLQKDLKDRKNYPRAPLEQPLVGAFSPRFCSKWGL
jgi:hypothetical protein